MPQNFLKNKVLFALGVTALLSKIAQLQMFAANKFPITPEQHYILSVLSENGELYQRQICEIAYKDRPNITRLINILEKKGLVKRVPDIHKRKVYKIIITEEGRKLHSEIKEYMIALRDEVVKDIKTEDMENCLNVMLQMIDNLEPIAKIQI